MLGKALKREKYGLDIELENVIVVSRILHSKDKTQMIFHSVQPGTILEKKKLSHKTKIHTKSLTKQTKR